MKTYDKFAFRFAIGEIGFILLIVIITLLFCSCSTLRKEPVLITRHLENGFEGIYLSDMKYLYVQTDDSTNIGEFYTTKEGITGKITILKYTERENEVISNVAPFEKLLKHKRVE